MVSKHREIRVFTTDKQGWVIPRREQPEYSINSDHIEVTSIAYGNANIRYLFFKENIIRFEVIEFPTEEDAIRNGR